MLPLIILTIENDDNRKFMASIYLEFYALMMKTALDIVHNRDVAEDMVQDTVASLIRNLGTIRNYDKRHLVSYVVKSVRNHSINYYNKNIKDGGRTYYGLDDDIALSIPDTSKSPSEHIELMDEYEELGMVIKQLPEAERDILYLKYNMEMNDQAIAEIMGIKKDSVRTYLTRARRNAKNLILKGGVTVAK